MYTTIECLQYTGITQYSYGHGSEHDSVVTAQNIPWSFEFICITKQEAPFSFQKKGSSLFQKTWIIWSKKNLRTDTCYWHGAELLEDIGNKAHSHELRSRYSFPHVFNAINYSVI